MTWKQPELFVRIDDLFICLFYDIATSALVFCAVECKMSLLRVVVAVHNTVWLIGVPVPERGCTHGISQRILAACTIN